MNSFGKSRWKFLHSACAITVLSFCLLHVQSASAAVVYEYRPGLNNYVDKTFGYDQTYVAGSYFIPNTDYAVGSISFVLFRFENTVDQVYVEIRKALPDKTIGELVATSNTQDAPLEDATSCDLSTPLVTESCFTKFSFPEQVTLEASQPYFILLKTTAQGFGMYVRFDSRQNENSENTVLSGCSLTSCTVTLWKMWMIIDDTIEAPLEESCCSSVAFLPGVQASRLYSGSGEKLWEPFSNGEIKKLYMDTNGQSIDPHVYTEDITDQFKAFSLAGPHIYTSFIQNMDALVHEGTLAQWKALPYDWREDVRDIVEEGVLHAGGTIYLDDEIESLAAHSKSGKVTIVAHSNGGLVAKALMMKLEAEGKANLVDKIIFVAVPQLGTPEAAKILLHGMDILGGVYINNETSRTLSENMPGGYGLLPSKKYFETVTDPVVTFDANANDAGSYREQYGASITTYDKLRKFLLGFEGRAKPSAIDVAMPNILNSSLLAKAEATHDELDAWQPPAGVKLVQVAGWGIETFKGIKYVTKYPCGKAMTTGVCKPRLDPEPILTVEGDKTVVYPSAVSEPNGNKIYFDIKLFNNDFHTNLNHKDLFQSQKVIDYVQEELLGNESKVDYFSTTIPEIDEIDKRISVSIHSPADIQLYDTERNHTGILSRIDEGASIEENIPNSYYMELGEGKYAGFDSNIGNTIKIQGTGVGTFTFEVERKTGDTTISTELYPDILTTPMTKAQYIVSDTPRLSLDVDGDNTVDFTMQSSEEIDPVLFLQIAKKTLLTLQLPQPIEKQILQKIDKAITILQKDKKKKLTPLIKQFSRMIEDKKLKHSKILTLDQKTALIEMINNIVDNIK